MLYFRAIFDMATVVKMVADKVSAIDRIQMLTMLKAILDYLESADMLGASKMVYDEPMVVVRNLIISIEKTDQSNFDESMLITKSSSTAKSAAKRKFPKVSSKVAVKRGPSPDQLSDGDDDDYENDSNDDIIEAAENATVTEEVTDWQPIDALQYAISSLTQDLGNSAPSSSPSKPKKKKSFLSGTGLKQFLAPGEEYINPLPRVRSADGVSKWPKYGRWVCGICRRICTNVDMFKSHLKSHKHDGSLSCRFCRKEILNAELVPFHTCAQKNRCNVCKKVFGKPSKLRIHMNSHYKSTIVSIKCNLCMDAHHYSSVVECAQHVYEVHENNIVCDSCFSEMDPFDVVATDPLRIYCQNCANKAGEGNVPTKSPVNPNTDLTIVSEKMKFYQRNSNPPTPKPKGTGDFYCEACDFRTYTHGLFEKHAMTNKHTRNVFKLSGQEPPSFSCSGCDKTFLTERYRDEHYRRNHIGPPVALSCNICDKNFVTKAGFNTHMRYHLNLRDFPCPDCDLAFNSKSDLTNHQQWKHTDGVQHTCETCNEQFKNRRLIRFHMRVVHDRLMFCCPDCDFEATKPYSLKEHMRLRHPLLTWKGGRNYLKRSDKPYVPPRAVKLPRLWSDDEADLSGDQDNSGEASTVVTREKKTPDAPKKNEGKASNVSDGSLSISKISLRSKSK